MGGWEHEKETTLAGLNHGECRFVLCVAKRRRCEVDLPARGWGARGSWRMRIYSRSDWPFSYMNMHMPPPVSCVNLARLPLAFM